MESESQIVRAILRQNEFLLRRHLVLSRTVLDQMKEAGIIVDVTRRKIFSAPSHRQVPVLLSCLEQVGLVSLKKFLNVLKSTGHSWMVDMILDTDVSATSQSKWIQEDGVGSPRWKHSYVRPQAKGSNSLRSNIRRNITAGVTSHDGLPHTGLSLGSLLKSREAMDPETAPRGSFHAGTLLADTSASEPMYPLETRRGLPLSHQPHVVYPRSKEEIPLTLYGLNQAFTDQGQKNQQTLSVLRQEEIAIRQLMEQNARDQGHIRRQQAAVQDIVVRLRDIDHKAREVYEPSPNPNIGRYRLAQLNKIPWSIDT